MYKVVVYGTLRSGESNHGLLEGSELLGTTTVNGYGMVSLGFFPAAFKMKGYSLVGEVYEVEDFVLEDLDMLEGYDRVSPESGMYDRVLVDTEFGEAFMYVYNGDIEAYSDELIHDWKEVAWLGRLLWKC